MIVTKDAGLSRLATQDVLPFRGGAGIGFSLPACGFVRIFDWLM